MSNKTNRAARADRAKDGKTLRRMARRDKAARRAFEKAATAPRDESRG